MYEKSIIFIISVVMSADVGLSGNKRTKEVDYLLLTPLVYAPVLPLINIGLRSHPAALRSKVFGVTIATAIVHGYWLISRSYTKTTR